MSLKMNTAEREAFLADLHVGVISIAEAGRGPLTAPIWYAYEPGGEVWVVIDPGSRKAGLLRKAERFSLCAQTEAAPYKYVSVEGAVVAIESADREDVRTMAHRYLGPELGDAYVAQGADSDAQLKVRMRPERWLTTDYTKQFSVEGEGGGAS